MATRHRRPHTDKVQVHLRLYRPDVQAVKARAATQGLPWQTLLRSLVHQALTQKEVVA